MDNSSIHDRTDDDPVSPLPPPVVMTKPQRRRGCWLSQLCTVLCCFIRLFCCVCFCLCKKRRPKVNPEEQEGCKSNRSCTQDETFINFSSSAAQGDPGFSERSTKVQDVSPNCDISSFLDSELNSVSSHGSRILTINRDLTRAQLGVYFNPSLTYRLLTIEFDLRQLPPQVTAQKAFLILQRAFLHPNIQEFRIRIDNWRNHIHQQENILPKDDKIDLSIRTSYPMRLDTLIIYCPGMTLKHLLICRGFILSQTALTTLIVNFDSILWRFYLPILKTLKTLQKLELYAITNYNGTISKIKVFNWVHIAHLENLQSLKLWGDCRYYGLRHRNLDSLKINHLTEIELKYVDLSVQDLQHLLASSRTLSTVNLQFFTPIPPASRVQASQFIQIVSACLAEQTVQSLSFTDHKLPGSIMERHLSLSGRAAKFGYTSTWTMPDNSYDLMTFTRLGQRC